MKWKKLGRIFRPTEHKLCNNCKEYAQSPQALILDDIVRVYFASREKDKFGKYLSHIHFVDFDMDFKRIIKVSSSTVIKLGRIGTFDEHGIFPINVIRDGNRILAYTSGWYRRESVLVDSAIGLAVSNDNGVTFKRVGDGPVLAPSLHEPFLIADPFVMKHNGTFHMWYIYGIRWITHEDGNAPDRVYKIGHATSNDGISWNRDGRQVINDKLNSDECQALPSIVYYKNKYHMYFCYREATGFRKNKDRAYRIGYAVSYDLYNWSRNDNLTGIDVSPNNWDSDMMCYPHVFVCNKKLYLLYNGNEFGRYGFGLAVLDEN